MTLSAADILLMQNLLDRSIASMKNGEDELALSQ